MSFDIMTLEEVLDDLQSRFIINIPEEELSSIERICFQIEQAHWFYEDFVRERAPILPSFSLKNFSALFFRHCPLLHAWAHDHEKAFATFMEYKVRVPVCGAVILNAKVDKVLLVRGWKATAGWGFPKGKINKDEPEIDCAVREVHEETGFDVSPYIHESQYIERTMREQRIRLYMAVGVPENAEFVTQTRKEIGDIQWFKLSELPGWRKGGPVPSSTTAKPNKFYMVTAFASPLKRWISSYKKQAKKLGAAGQQNGVKNGRAVKKSRGGYKSATDIESDADGFSDSGLKSDFEYKTHKPPQQPSSAKVLQDTGNLPSSGSNLMVPPINHHHHHQHQQGSTHQQQHQEWVALQNGTDPASEALRALLKINRSSSSSTNVIDNNRVNNPPMAIATSLMNPPPPPPGASLLSTFFPELAKSGTASAGGASGGGMDITRSPVLVDSAIAYASPPRGGHHHHHHHHHHSGMGPGMPVIPPPPTPPMPPHASPMLLQQQPIFHPPSPALGGAPVPTPHAPAPLLPSSSSSLSSLSMVSLTGAPGFGGGNLGPRAPPSASIPLPNLATPQAPPAPPQPHMPTPVNKSDLKGEEAQAQHRASLLSILTMGPAAAPPSTIPVPVMMPSGARGSVPPQQGQPRTAPVSAPATVPTATVEASSGTNNVQDKQRMLLDILVGGAGKAGGSGTEGTGLGLKLTSGMPPFLQSQSSSTLSSASLLSSTTSLSSSSSAVVAGPYRVDDATVEEKLERRGMELKSLLGVKSPTAPPPPPQQQQQLQQQLAVSAQDLKALLGVTTTSSPVMLDREDTETGSQTHKQRQQHKPVHAQAPLSIKTTPKLEQHLLAATQQGHVSRSQSLPQQPQARPLNQHQPQHGMGPRTASHASSASAPSSAVLPLASASSALYTPTLLSAPAAPQGESVYDRLLSLAMETNGGVDSAGAGGASAAAVPRRVSMAVGYKYQSHQSLKGGQESGVPMKRRESSRTGRVGKAGKERESQRAREMSGGVGETVLQEEAGEGEVLGMGLGVATGKVKQRSNPLLNFTFDVDRIVREAFEVKG
ncbi:mRNA-decapping enzyme subunit 2 [Quaeritorhiza haematococci]|nr:mRNA-decapping enzyme subunit 2 [Quaeritorhiza haematococci]